MQATSPKPMALTMGDPCGIGPEIVVKALYAWAERSATPCWVAGNAGAIEQAMLDHCARSQLGAKQLLSVSTPELANQQLAATPNAIVVVDDGLDLRQLAYGEVSEQAGTAAAAAIACAANACLQGHASAMVTAPIHKLSIAKAGVTHPGHTELLQDVAARHRGVSVHDLPVRMLLVNPHIQTVLLSIHVPLRQALEQVTAANLLQTLLLTQQWVAPRHKPAHQADAGLLRIAVAGVNPHAGEGGRFGREEIDNMMPAIEQARAQGLCVSDPLAPDTVYMRAKAGEFDVVIAAYHDQGLIPLKYLGVADGVNVTLGLPFIRSSPDHGTAFDIAGTGVADASSLLQAMHWAELAAARQLGSR